MHGQKFTNSYNTRQYLLSWWLSGMQAPPLTDPPLPHFRRVGHVVFDVGHMQVSPVHQCCHNSSTGCYPHGRGNRWQQAGLMLTALHTGIAWCFKLLPLFLSLSLLLLIPTPMYHPSFLLISLLIWPWLLSSTSSLPPHHSPSLLSRKSTWCLNSGYT